MPGMSIGSIERTLQGKSLNCHREVTNSLPPEGLNEKEHGMDLPNCDILVPTPILSQLWRACAAHTRYSSAVYRDRGAVLVLKTVALTFAVAVVLLGYRFMLLITLHST